MPITPALVPRFPHKGHARHLSCCSGPCRAPGTVLSCKEPEAMTDPQEQRGFGSGTCPLPHAPRSAVDATERTRGPHVTVLAAHACHPHLSCPAKTACFFLKHNPLQAKSLQPVLRVHWGAQSSVCHLSTRGLAPPDQQRPPLSLHLLHQACN